MMSLIHHPDDLKNRDISHCVVLSRNSEPSAETLAALTSANLDFAVANDELTALAQALLCERLDTARATWGLRSTGCIVLIIESAPSWNEIELLIDALSTYCDNALVLQLDGHESCETEPTSHNFVEPQESSSSIVSEEAPITDPPTTEEDDPDDRTDFISAEEIAMLLGRPDEEDACE